MALRLLCVSIFLFLQSALTEQIAPCDSTNTVWRYGYKPEPTCANLFPVDTSLAEGYFCIDNYVRDTNDECIYIYDCPQFKVETTTLPTCPAGESYRTELYPEPSCSDLYPEARGIKEGCYCDDHTVRNPQGKCVSVYECLEYISTTTTASTPVCPAGEFYMAGLYPEPTCDNFFPEDVFFKEGCFCPEDQVRDDTGKCISYLICPQIVSTTTTPAATPVCPAGEYYMAGLYPEPTCDNFFPEDVFFKEGCFCPEDQVRDNTGKCISYLICPQIVTTTTTTTTPAATTCPAGEELRVDLYPEPACDVLFPEYGNLKEACFCQNDDVRNSAGKCVSIAECPQFTTPAPSSLTPAPCADDEVYAPRSFLPTTFKCIPGSTFKVDCNTCQCNDEGTSATCTLMACAPEEITAPSQTCPVDEVWTTGLYPEPSCDNFYPENVYVSEGCFCQENYIRNSDGKCIEIGECDLFKKSKPSDTPEVTIYEFTCIPGETFKVDCNLCTCSEDGKSTICTTFSCGPKDNNFGSACPEGEIFGKGMYPEATCDNFFPDYSEIKEGCFCPPGLVRNSAGKCISMYDCSAPASTTTPASSEFECCPGTASYLPCQVCICNEDGKGETCYDIPCSEY